MAPSVWPAPFAISENLIREREPTRVWDMVGLVTHAPTFLGRVKESGVQGGTIVDRVRGLGVSPSCRSDYFDPFISTSPEEYMP